MMIPIRALVSMLLVILAASKTIAFEVPANLKAFSNHIKDGQCTGGKILKSDFFSETGKAKSMGAVLRNVCSADGITAFAYCKDNKTGVLYLHGTSSRLANMDIDCDGNQSDPGDG